MSQIGQAVRASKESLHSKGSQGSGGEPASQVAYNLAAEPKAPPSVRSSQAGPPIQQRESNQDDQPEHSAQKSSTSQVGKLRALRQSTGKSAASNLQVVLYEGPTDRASYFEQLRSSLEPTILKQMETDFVEPLKEHVFSDLINGKTEIEELSDPAEQRKKVFDFISNESQTVIQSNVKQLVANMDQLQRKHYEQKVSSFEQQVKEARSSGAPTSIEQLMLKVGLSPRLKDKVDKFEGTVGGQRGFELQNQTGKPQRGATDRSTLQENSFLGALLLSPTGASDARHRNVAQGISQTEIGPLHPHAHKKLLQKLHEEKNERKRREEQRRLKTLEKYQRDAEEKSKLEEEVKQRLAEEKLQKHKDKLDKIQNKAEERKAKIQASERAYKEIESAKPLYVKFQEQYEQQTESQELAKQKKALEDKRNFANQMPAGGFKRAFGEHEVNYKLKKEKIEAELAKKREQEKSMLKNHYGSLKYKPKKLDLAQQLNSPLVEKGSPGKEVNSSLKVRDNGPEILSNRFLEEIKQKELAKQKLVKMSAYQKSIQELYMPKQSEKLKMEREANQANLKTNPREKRPFKNYLGHVKDLNKKRTERGDSRESGVRRLQAVASLPSLHNRDLKSEQKLTKSPMVPKPDSSHNFRRARQSQPTKVITAEKDSSLGRQAAPEASEFIDWQRSRKQTKMGNQYMEEARKLVAGTAEIFNDEDLQRVQAETGLNKRDHLATLNRKVKQFEERVAREEVLMRNRAPRAAAPDGVGPNDSLFDAQSQVNDQYIKAIEAKLKILDKL